MSAHKTLKGNWYEERAWEGTRKRVDTTTGNRRKGRAPANYPGALAHTSHNTGRFHAGGDGLSLPHSAEETYASMHRVAYAPPRMHVEHRGVGVGARAAARKAQLLAQAAAEVEAEEALQAAAERVDPADWASSYQAEVAGRVPEPVEIDEAVLGVLPQDQVAGTYAALLHDRPVSVWREQEEAGRVGTASTGANVFGRNDGFSVPVQHYRRAYTKLEEEAGEDAVKTNRTAFASHPYIDPSLPSSSSSSR